MIFKVSDFILQKLLSIAVNQKLPAVSTKMEGVVAPMFQTKEFNNEDAYKITDPPWQIVVLPTEFTG